MSRHRAAVLGSPVEHSLSPVLHRAAYVQLGLDWSYDAIGCDEGALPERLAELSSDYAGLSLTMPLKTAVVPLLAELDERVAVLGACNTVVRTDDAGWHGFNTDVDGVLATLDELGVDRLHTAVVLGGGGAARAVLGALAERGCRAVTVLLRDLAKGPPLIALGERIGLPVVLEPWDAAEGALAEAALVVSAAPAGSTDHLADVSWAADAVLVDLVYAPWPTALAAAAAAAGARVAGGLPVLVGQAAEQVRLMTGRPAPVEAMRAAGEAALG